METLWFSIYSIMLSACSDIMIYVDQRYWLVFFFFFWYCFCLSLVSGWRWPHRINLEVFESEKNESESCSGNGVFFSILGNSLRKIDINSSLYVWWHSSEALWSWTLVWEVLIIDSVSILVSDLFKLSISS